jgi:hypothetical protein
MLSHVNANANAPKTNPTIIRHACPMLFNSSWNQQTEAAIEEDNHMFKEKKKNSRRSKFRVI